MTERKYVHIIYLTEDWYPSLIKNSQNSIRRKLKLNEKWAKDLSKHFTKEDMKCCSTSSVIREMQMNTYTYKKVLNLKN